MNGKPDHFDLMDRRRLVNCFMAYDQRLRTATPETRDEYRDRMMKDTRAWPDYRLRIFVRLAAEDPSAYESSIDGRELRLAQRNLWQRFVGYFKSMI